MDEFNYQDIMAEFYSRISEFVRNHKDVAAELDEKSRIFETLNMDEGEKKRILFDWFIFDCKSDALSKNLLRYFLDNEPLDEKIKAIYRGFLSNAYSVFEVKALRIGKEAIINDLTNGKEYNVKDTTFTKNIQKGEIVLLRVLPIHGYYILTGIGHVFPEKTASMTKLFFKSHKTPQGKSSLNPLDICKMFFAQEQREKLPPEERLKLFCREADLEPKYIEQMINKLEKRAKIKGRNSDIIKDVFNKIKPFPEFNSQELSQAFIDLWNSFIAKNDPSSIIGPTENVLIHACMGYMQSKVNPDNYKDIKKLEAKADKVNDEWLNSPKEELGGKTPVEAILEERQNLGNPCKKVGFLAEFNKLEPGADILKQAEDLFYKGMECLKKNKPADAIEAYKAYCVLNSKNHVVWCNMGLAHGLLLDKKKSIECFKKALEIKPDYKMAKNNLRIAKNTTKKDMERMAREHRVIFNKSSRKIDRNNKGNRRIVKNKFDNA
ncbi:MAG: hypothetical protein P9M02_04745 [Candidatus Susulua stagnicola]|nr:hypothetical protein [Candidatus Susulua stagnicola]